jgi:S-adenosylmethionine:tRNA-ribosyltransferase-isomerase (queuine synthetase)
MNDSRVLHARMLGRKESGGQVEVLVERLLDEREVLAQVRASKSPQPGSQLLLEDAVDVHVLRDHLLRRPDLLPVPRPYLDNELVDL